MADKSVAVMVRLNPETYKRFELYRKQLGMNKTSFASMSITAGMEAVLRSVHPESAWPPGLVEKLAAGMVAAAKPEAKKLLRGVSKGKAKR